MSTQSFAELGASRVVIDALAKSGVTTPFAIQNQVIADAIAGRDVIARSPTGSGKTLAFAIPVVERLRAEDRRPAALVLAPTRELATQIVAELRPLAHARALRVTAVYGGVGLLKQSNEAAQSHILVATPGRLEDLLARRAFNLDHIRMLILDEADRMLDMGFRPAIDRIVGACPYKRQTLFFSATLDGEAGTIARSYANDPVTHEHGPKQRRANEEIDHEFVTTTHGDRLDTLLTQLDRERDLALVFVRTKHGADRLVKRLAAEGVQAVAMHGNKTQRQREIALARFESGAVDTLVATDVAARGIDVERISHVINFDPPHDSETYVHRIGRTGRAGRKGVGVTLVSPDQTGDVVKIAGQLQIEHDLRRHVPQRPARPEHGSARSEHGGGGHRGSARASDMPAARPGNRHVPAGGNRHAPAGGNRHAPAGGNRHAPATGKPARQRRARQRPA